MDKYVAMQAIKSVKDGRITGYEVMFQQDQAGLYNSQETAAADTIADFLMQNTEQIFTEKKTFITFTPTLLFRNTPKIFSKEKLIIQLEDNVIIHPLAPIMIKKYHDEGYRVAINDFQFAPKYFAMLDFADYVKLNMHSVKSEKDKISIENIVHMVSAFNKECVATGVDTKEEYDLAIHLHMDYLQGNYIAESSMSRSRRINFLEGNFFQLVVEVSKEEPDIDALEEIFNRDASLAYSLLKMVNSAYFALRKRTSSIRQALVTMGLNQLKQWVYLLSYNREDERDEEVESLMKTSFLRANFCEDLSTRIPDFPISKSEAYMMGMFSTLEYLVDAPLEDILNEISMTELIKDALLKKEGVCGMLYELVLAYERLDWKMVKEHSAALGIPQGVLAQAYMDCMEIVNGIWNDLVKSSQEIAPPVANETQETSS